MTQTQNVKIRVFHWFGDLSVIPAKTEKYSSLGPPGLSQVYLYVGVLAYCFMAWKTFWSHHSHLASSRDILDRRQEKVKVRGEGRSGCFAVPDRKRGPYWAKDQISNIFIDWDREAKPKGFLALRWLRRGRREADHSDHTFHHMSSFDPVGTWGKNPRWAVLEESVEMNFDTSTHAGLYGGLFEGHRVTQLKP